jgi:hypothetical protein
VVNCGTHAQANPAFHAKTTGPEIVADFEGKRLDYWVTGCVTLCHVVSRHVASRHAPPRNTSEPHVCRTIDRLIYGQDGDVAVTFMDYYVTNDACSSLVLPNVNQNLLTLPTVFVGGVV